MTNQGSEQDPASQQRAALRDRRGGVEDERLKPRRTPNKPENTETSGRRRVTRLQDLGLEDSLSYDAKNIRNSENVAQDRLGALPPELFEAVTGNIDDVKDLESLSLASKSYQKYLGNTVKDISHRKFTREAAVAIFDNAISDGIPTVTWQGTMPEIRGDEAQPHAAIAGQLGRVVGPVIRFLDDNRQRDFAAKIIAANPEVRGEIIDWMVDHMSSLKREYRRKIFDAVVDDFANEDIRYNIAGTLEDATWRGNLTGSQLDRVFRIRMANPDAERDYEENVRRNYGARLDGRREGQSSGDRTQSAGRGEPYGVKVTSDALKYNADPAGRLDRFAEASNLLAVDARTARGDVVAAREPRAAQKPDDLREEKDEPSNRVPDPQEHNQSRGRSHQEGREMLNSMQPVADSVRQNIVHETTDRAEEYDTDLFDDIDLDVFEKSARDAMAIRGKNAGSSSYGLDDRSDERNPAARPSL